MKLNDYCKPKPRPVVGQWIDGGKRYGRLVIVEVYAAGTIDVRDEQGRHFRMTGLQFS